MEWVFRRHSGGAGSSFGSMGTLPGPKDKSWRPSPLKAYEKCFQNLHFVEQYEEHTIAHAIHTKYEKTKIYLWPGPMRSGMSAGRTVETILYLAGFSNVKSKVIGSRNPLNIVKALFKALNAECIINSAFWE